MKFLQPAVSQGSGCDGHSMLKNLMTIGEALSCIAEHVQPIDVFRTVPLSAALGRVLARPLQSRAMAPAFDNAAMDGYAITTTALSGDAPWVLKVTERVAAGQQATMEISGASAARIFTGAPIPIGADAVVMQEEVERKGDHIQIHHRPTPGMNIRLAGSDMEEGTAVLDKGRRLGPREIAACAAAGADTVQVTRKIRVALLVTGDEVRRAGSLREAAQIPDVNTPMLTAILKAAGVRIVAITHGADNRAGLARQLSGLAAKADLVITTGGISVGEEDHVLPALASQGGTVLFSGVAIKPGKPVSFGTIGNTFWLGLPGNPLSAFVTWHVFGAALVRRLADDRSTLPAPRSVVISAAIRRKPGRYEFRLATLCGFDGQGREMICFEEATHSGRVGLLPVADGLMLLPPDLSALPAGALIEFQPFCPA